MKSFTSIFDLKLDLSVVCRCNHRRRNLFTFSSKEKFDKPKFEQHTMISQMALKFVQMKVHVQSEGNIIRKE